jgi:hypothetical protein
LNRGIGFRHQGGLGQGGFKGNSALHLELDLQLLGMNRLKGLLDLGLIMVPDPIPEEFVGNLDGKGILFFNGSLGGFEPSLKALTVKVFFEVF